MDEDFLSNEDKKSWGSYNDPLWLEFRQQILERDHYTCKCGSSENLRVHHLYYLRTQKLWEYPLSACITLCNDCHEKIHKEETPIYFPIEKLYNITKSLWEELDTLRKGSEEYNKLQALINSFY